MQDRCCQTLTKTASKAEGCDGVNVGTIDSIVGQKLRLQYQHK